MSLSNWILVLTHVVLAPLTATHALLAKRDSRSAFGWISVCVLFPLAGPVLYALFGINRVRSRARQLVDENKQLPSRLHTFLNQERASPALSRSSGHALASVPDGALGAIGGRISAEAALPGNRVEPLINGEQVYPAMLDAIASASTSVWLCSYILDNDSTGGQFVDALAAARQRGADVKVLIDGVGRHYSVPAINRRLKRAGVPTENFLPPRLLPPSIHLNLRNHRKVLVVDGETAFTGGMNISDRHLADLTGLVHDVHFRITGPVVTELASVFARDWTFATGEALPSLPPDATTHGSGSSTCRVITDGPDDELDRLSMLINSVVSAATRQVLIMTPYFLPSRELVGVLQSAAVRGVDVRIVLPAKNNLWFVHAATRNQLWELLQYGVRVFYQEPPFVHTKLLVIDGKYSLIGSANLDPRSLRLNFELGVEVFCSRFAAQAGQHILQTLPSSREVTFAEVESRSLPGRLRDSICWLFSPYL